MVRARSSESSGRRSGAQGERVRGVRGARAPRRGCRGGRAGGRRARHRARTRARRRRRRRAGRRARRPSSHASASSAIDAEAHQRVDLQLDALEHDVARARRRRVVVDDRVDLRALGDRAAGGVGEVLAEVRGREVRERAEPDARRASRARRPRRSRPPRRCRSTSRISARSCTAPPRALARRRRRRPPRRRASAPSPAAKSAPSTP